MNQNDLYSADIFFFKISALYKSFTYLVTCCNQSHWKQRRRSHYTHECMHTTPLHTQYKQPFTVSTLHQATWWVRLTHHTSSS